MRVRREDSVLSVSLKTSLPPVMAARADSEHVTSLSFFEHHRRHSDTETYLHSALGVITSKTIVLASPACISVRPRQTR